ncbi:hypothetical protein C815_01934 [Firmicutes bacterium M10-2]|nr:hypothetical protein C815_01934 [Firmicutes bacterium M10-2]
MQKNQIYLIAVIDAVLFIVFAYQMITSPSWLTFAILAVVGLNFVQLKGMYDKIKLKEGKKL